MGRFSQAPHRSQYRKIYKGIDLVHAHFMSEKTEGCTACTACTALEPDDEQLRNIRFAEMSFNVSCLNTKESGYENINSKKDIEGACSKCPLKNEAFVDGEGSGKVMIIGEAPGEEETWQVIEEVWGRLRGDDGVNQG